MTERHSINDTAQCITGTGINIDRTPVSVLQAVLDTNSENGALGFRLPVRHALCDVWSESTRPVIAVSGGRLHGGTKAREDSLATLPGVLLLPTR